MLRTFFFCLLIFTRETKREKLIFPARAARAGVGRGCFPSATAALLPPCKESGQGYQTLLGPSQHRMFWGKKQVDLKADKTLERAENGLWV